MEAPLLVQKIRKDNLKRIVKERFSDRIDAFSEFIGKNKYVVYAMLWDITNPNHRKVSDASARAIEQKLGIETFSLDLEPDKIVEDPSMLIVPLMDYKLSNDLGDIYLHNYDRVKLPKELFHNISSTSDLIGFKIPDMEMFPFYSIGDIVVINRLKRSIEDNHQYLILSEGKFCIRTLISKDNLPYIKPANSSVDMNHTNSKFKIFGIVDVEIRKKLYME